MNRNPADMLKAFVSKLNAGSALLTTSSAALYDLVPVNTLPNIIVIMTESD